MLRALNLDVSYSEGQGNWLQARDSHDRHWRVFDAAGGYAANVLGHAHPGILEAMRQAAHATLPCHVQGSIRGAAAHLAADLEVLVAAETGIHGWISHFTNSGTEAVEAALKHALLVNRAKRDNLGRRILESLIELAQIFQGTHPAHLDEELDLYLENRSRALALPVPTSLFQGLEQVRDAMLALLDVPPLLAAFQGSYHGKTLGALGLTSNPELRLPFLSAPEPQRAFLPFDDAESLVAWTERQRGSLVLPILRGHHLATTEVFLPLVAAFIVEPVQGEGGVRPAGGDFLTTLRRCADDLQASLILDEVQTGCRRTGPFLCSSALGIVADTYCLSKGLGGGYVKLGATLFHPRHYDDRFGFLHSSTFAEDEFSSTVGRYVLSLLAPDELGTQVTARGLELLAGLRDLQQRYPLLVAGIRGRGLLVALEFSADIAQRVFEFKVFDDCDCFGYLLAGALLHREGVRVMPTLSSPRTLRFAPSLLTDTEEVAWLLAALKRLCEHLERLDLDYLLGQAYRGHRLGPATRLTSPLRKVPGLPTAAFLTHLIDENHIRSFAASHRLLPSGLIERKLDKASDLFEFGLYHSSSVNGATGNSVRFLLLGIPVLSSSINAMSRSGRNNFIGKIQAAVTLAVSHGASTIGLGQFTSIVTHNGLLLDPRGATLTTGNSYTAWLAVEATLGAAREHHGDLHRTTLACIGAAGNIIATCATLLADHVGRLILLHHTPPERSPKLLEALSLLFRTLSRGSGTSPLAAGIRALGLDPELLPPEQVPMLLRHPSLRDQVIVGSDLQLLSQAAVVLTGTNQTTPTVPAELLAPGAVVVDLGVPANLAPNLAARRPDLHLLRGGLAALPPQADGRPQALACPFLPLTAGTCYACLAETLTLALSGNPPGRYLGTLDPSGVLAVRELARAQGFSLAGSFNEEVR